MVVFVVWFFRSSIFQFFFFLALYLTLTLAEDCQKMAKYRIFHRFLASQSYYHGACLADQQQFPTKDHFEFAFDPTVDTRYYFVAEVQKQSLDRFHQEQMSTDI